MNLAATMSLATAAFTGPLHAAQAAVGTAVGGMKSAFGGLLSTLSLVGVSFAAFKGAEGFADALRGVFDAGKELKTLHAITGQSITDLVTLRKAFQEVGLAPESVEDKLVKLQKALGGVNEEGQPTGFMFQRLGLNIANLRGESAVQQLRQLSTAINGLGTDAERTAAVTAIFGRGGADLKALFANPEAIDEARKSLAVMRVSWRKTPGSLPRSPTPWRRSTARSAASSSASPIASGPSSCPCSTSSRIASTSPASASSSAPRSPMPRAPSMGFSKMATSAKRPASACASASPMQPTSSARSSTPSSDSRSMAKGCSTSSPGPSPASRRCSSGLADVISGAITKGIAASLRDLKVAGFEITDPNQLNKLNMQGNRLEDSGTERLNKGLEIFGKEGLAGGIAGLAKGILTPIKEAQQRLDEIVGRARTVPFLGIPTPAELPRPDINAPAATRLAGGPGSRDEGDRLAKIGLFVGNSGPANDYARQTAANTAKANSLTQRVIELLGQPVGDLDQKFAAFA